LAIIWLEIVGKPHPPNEPRPCAVTVIGSFRFGGWIPGARAPGRPTPS
jgi:hypothetical protein